MDNFMCYLLPNSKTWNTVIVNMIVYQFKNKYICNIYLCDFFFFFFCLKEYSDVIFGGTVSKRTIRL